MIFYDSIHETCITMPCAADVQEGQLCKFDLSTGIRCATAGESPDGLVKYVRGGKATVQIHGIITVPYTSEDYVVGKNSLAVDTSGFGIQLGSGSDKHMVIKTDHINHTITLMLG